MTEPQPDPTADALATPGALRTLLRGAPITDEQAADLVNRASGVVRDWCGWHITGPHEETFVVDGPGVQTLFLPTLALVSVTSVTEDGVALTTDDYEWSAAGMLRRCGGCQHWTDRFRGVTVVATHGVEEVPEGVSAVVLALAARAYANPTSQTSTLTGSVSDLFGSGHGAVAMTKFEQELLTPWRIR